MYDAGLPVCLCLVLAACGGGSVRGLPDGAKAELARYVIAYYSGASWRVKSAELAPNPDNVLNSHYPDETWCVVVSPVLVDSHDPLYRQRDTFFVNRSGADW